MSTDGTTFTRLMTYTVAQSGGGGAPGTWSTTNYNSLYTNTYDLPETADNVASLYLRFTNIETAKSSASGSNRIDNVTLTAVSSIPEPRSVLVGGLLLAGLFLRQRRTKGF